MITGIGNNSPLRPDNFHNRREQIPSELKASLGHFMNELKVLNSSLSDEKIKEIALAIIQLKTLAETAEKTTLYKKAGQDLSQILDATPNTNRQISLFAAATKYLENPLDKDFSALLKDYQSNSFATQTLLTELSLISGDLITQL